MAKPKRAMPSGKDLINYDFTYATRLTWCTLCPHPAKGVCRGYAPRVEKMTKGRHGAERVASKVRQCGGTDVVVVKDG